MHKGGKFTLNSTACFRKNVGEFISNKMDVNYILLLRRNQTKRMLVLNHLRCHKMPQFHIFSMLTRKIKIHKK